MKKPILALFFTLTVFLLGFFVGEIVYSIRTAAMIKKFYDLRLKILGYELELKLLQKSECSEKVLEEISYTKAEIGRKVDQLERIKGKNDPEIKELKEEYMLYTYLNYEFVKEFLEKCKLNKTLILFFYSNDPKYLKASEEQGFVLDYLYYKTNKSLQVFAFDLSIENPLLKGMITKYGIKTIPTLIINEKIKIEGFKNAEELEEILKNMR